MLEGFFYSHPAFSSDTKREPLTLEEPFYSKGLSFECTRCSACCRFDPGYVFLSETDLQRLTAFTGLDREDFISLYCRKVDAGGFKRLSLKEKTNNDCWFWEENGCTVYEARPLQCRSFPFWFVTMGSREAWDREAAHCPGINRGRVHTREEIEAWLSWRKREPYIEG